MRSRFPVFLALFSLLALGAADMASSAPVDTKVGDVRATFNKAGTPLRGSASTLAAPTATLPYATRVRVLEKTKGWFRVQTVTPPARTGWLRSFHTVEPSALRSNSAPAHLSTRGSAGVSGREVSAAGRQLDADTERGYRTSRQDLQRAYRRVDAMEAATQRIDPGDILMFIDAGDLGRAGRDYARPARIPGGPTHRARKKTRSKVGGLLGKLGGEAARRLGGGDTAGRVVESAITSTTEYVNQVKTKFTPRQEYFLGRAVAAEAIARYGVDPDANRRRYVRMVGDAIVRLSGRLPGNFGGYHFEVLNSDEINGVSGPGGFVLITRGAVQACTCESELAGVLCHELAHIRNQHGEKLLRSGREFPAMMSGLGSVAGAAAGGGAFSQGLVRFFGQAVKNVSATAIDHRYGRSMEFQADGEGTNLLFDVFYDHGALQRFLARMPPGGHAHGGAASHAPPAVRAQSVLAQVAIYPPYKVRAQALEARQSRFQQGTGVTVLPPK